MPYLTQPTHDDQDLGPMVSNRHIALRVLPKDQIGFHLFTLTGIWTPGQMSKIVTSFQPTQIQSLPGQSKLRQPQVKVSPSAQNSEQPIKRVSKTHQVLLIDWFIFVYLQKSFDLVVFWFCVGLFVLFNKYLKGHQLCRLAFSSYFSQMVPHRKLHISSCPPN